MDLTRLNLDIRIRPCRDHGSLIAWLNDTFARASIKKNDV